MYAGFYKTCFITATKNAKSPVTLVTIKIGIGDSVLFAGDFNARVVDARVEKLIGSHGEKNNNGNLFTNFATFNKLKITNKFSHTETFTN